MKFNIRGQKLEVTEPIRKYIESKIGKIDKYLENPDEITANVVVRVRGIDQIVEATIPTKKIILRGEESHQDLYAAIDLVSEKLERQIRRNKKRLSEKRSKEILVDFNMNFEIDEEEAEKEDIVKRKSIDVKPMSEEEAILQMNLLGHTFFVYKDMEDNSVCVLYRRKDGNYGVIETK